MSVWVWVDLEMTGLDPARDQIIEIAVMLTDDRLEIVAEGPDLAIAAPEPLLAGMDAWNRKHHQASGLLARVREEGVPLAEAEDEVLRFVARFAPRGEGILCGNSVHVDRRFLAAQMPRLEAWLHYRIIDVSTVKEIARRWYGLRPPPKKAAHRARDDILESIQELRFYRRVVFRSL